MEAAMAALEAEKAQARVPGGRGAGRRARAPASAVGVVRGLGRCSLMRSPMCAPVVAHQGTVRGEPDGAGIPRREPGRPRAAARQWSAAPTRADHAYGPVASRR
eukprot:324468-Alexandrium_andersonii.AAC.1